VTPAPVLHWAWCRFEQLSLDDLYDALALRCRVFILEQGAYLDPDGLDRVSWHLLGRDGSGVLQAYLRVVEPGARFSEPSMGRVITSPEVRGSGAGRLLVAEGVRRIWPASTAASATPCRETLTWRMAFPMWRCAELRWAGAPRSEVREAFRAEPAPVERAWT
jgi:predicted GNAT family N-acyltransferase